MTELSREARAIIDAARGGDEPSAADRRRVRIAVMANIAAGASGAGVGHAAGGGGGGGPSTIMNVSQGMSALGMKALVGAVMIGGLGLGGVWLATRDDGRVSRPALVVEDVASGDVRVSDSAEAETGTGTATETGMGAAETGTVTGTVTEAVTNTATATATEATPSPSAVAGAKTGAAARKRPEKPAPAPDDAEQAYAEEQRLIASARRSLRGGDAERALVLLDDHAARFADGILRQERDGTRVLALCLAGRSAEGAAERDAFLVRWPRAPMAAQVRGACP